MRYPKSKTRRHRHQTDPHTHAHIKTCTTRMKTERRKNTVVGSPALLHPLPPKRTWTRKERRKGGRGHPAVAGQTDAGASGLPVYLFASFPTSWGSLRSLAAAVARRRIIGAGLASTALGAALLGFLFSLPSNVTPTKRLEFYKGFTLSLVNQPSSKLGKARNDTAFEFCAFLYESNIDHNIAQKRKKKKVGKVKFTLIKFHFTMYRNVNSSQSTSRSA